MPTGCFGDSEVGKATYNTQPKSRSPQKSPSSSGDASTQQGDFYGEELLDWPSLPFISIAFAPSNVTTESRKMLQEKLVVVGIEPSKTKPRRSSPQTSPASQRKHKISMEKNFQFQYWSTFYTNSDHSLSSSAFVQSCLRSNTIWIYTRKTCNTK